MCPHTTIDKSLLCRLILELVEEDREFRHAVMAVAGYRDILDRIVRLEERQQRLEERFAELEERFARLEERFAKLEEKFAKLEERFARLEERQQKLEERLEKLDKTLVTIAHRFEVLSEVAFREAMRGVLEKYFWRYSSALDLLRP